MQHYSLKEMIGVYYNKFPNQQLIISIPYSLSWFEEAEESEDPTSLKGQTWKGEKKIFSKM